MADPAIVQDGASSVGLGDAGKRVMEQYGLEKEISKAEKAQSASKKAGEAQIMSQYGSVLSKPYEEFKPSQESASGFAALGSLLMVAGGMMGGKGRLAGIGAMNNIAGMMKGYQQGRKDLYEQERTQFEENMKVFEKNRTLIKEAFDRALKMAPYNLTTAQNNLRKELSGLGATIPAEMTAKSGLVQAAGQHDTFHTNTTNTLQSLKDKLGLSLAQQKAYEADVKVKKESLATTAEEALIKEREATAAEKAVKKTAATPLTDDAKRTAAEQYLLGNTRVLTNLSREAKAEILNSLPDIAREKGMSQEDIVAAQQKFIADSAEARTLGSMTARTAAPAAEAQLFGQYAKELSKAVPRGKFVPVTKLIQTAEENISDSNLLAFRAATNTFINEYSRAITPVGSTTDAARKKAFSLLSTATSQEAFDRVVDVMNKEMEYAQEALKTTRGTVTGGSSAPAAPAAPVAPAAPSAPVASLKDIQFTAQKYGKTVDEIKKILRDAGRKIEGE